MPAAKSLTESLTLPKTAPRRQGELREDYSQLHVFYLLLLNPGARSARAAQPATLCLRLSLVRKTTSAKATQGARRRAAYAHAPHTPADPPQPPERRAGRVLLGRGCLITTLITTAGAWEKRKQTNLNTDPSFPQTLTSTPAREVGVPTALVQ